jgi:twitching motility protein PilT
MREDPDVLFIGEIRDLETLEVALHAAESGHAVYATFHTHGALNAVLRLLAMFPAEEQMAVRMRMAEALRGVVSQMLVQRRGASARILVTEVMINNYRIKECLRDPARTAAITQVLEKSNEQLMHTFDQALMLLTREGLVSAETALMHASNPSDLKRNLTLAGLAA